mgnify:CR=1 FL=1
MLYRFDVHRNKDKIAIGPKSLTKKRKVEDRKIEIPTNFVQGKQTDRPQIKNKACTLIQPQFFLLKMRHLRQNCEAKYVSKAYFELLFLPVQRYIFVCWPKIRNVHLVNDLVTE